MGSRGAVLSVCGSRNCFIKIPSSWTSNIDKNRLQVYQVQTVEGSGVMFTTWQGDISSSTPSSTDIVEINGLYAAKQGLTDGAEVLVNRIENVQTCERLFVEPLSIDDWEILELHAEYLEQHLLDQVRVAWKGQVMPLWVNNKICIFVRVESAEPASDCCLLEQMTELHIAPKDRRRTGTPAVKSSAVKPSVKKDMGPPSKSALESHMRRDQQGGSVPHPKVAHTNSTLPEQGTNPQINEDVFQRLIGYFHNLLFGAKPPDGHGENLLQNELYDEYSYKREILPLARRLTASFRTQPCLDLDVISNNGAGPGGSGHEPQVEIPPVPIVSQPTCIYIKSTSFCDILHKLDLTLGTTTMPSTFLALLRPSKTPAERDEAITKKMLNKKPLGTEKAKPSQTDGLPDESEMEPQHVVRVVLLDSDNSYTLHGGSGAAIASVRFGGSKGPLAGHVVVGDLLRRQLSLPVTGRVCLQALVDADNTAVPPADVTGITLHPLFTVPAGFTEEMMVMAFKSWIRQVTCLDCPLVVSNGTLIKLFLQQDLYGEFLLTLDYLKPSVLPVVPVYCLLQCGLCEDLTIKVAARMTAANKPSNIQLPCWKLSEIDPKLPAVSLQQLGGVKDLFDELKSHLQVSLAVRPLDAHLMGQHRGQRGGAVLLTGPKGSGKSSLARAICQSLAELPPLAHVTTIDCKPLRGKRVDAIQKLLNKAFSEAAWRQPAVILLDDLDHITAAPAGPEQEMSGEAVYFTRVAAVLKDLCQREVMENSAVVVMATCRSQGSLHSALTSSRGHHFCQKVVHINPTDKVQRKAMLEALLAFKSGVKDNCVQGLDLVKVAGQTEGHVVRDLEQIVDRALHALRMNKNNQEGRRKELQDADFQVALKGFTPMGLRHVTLHDSGNVTWSNVGGLHDVRRALVETLQWPSKYPQLFASCPLRLRAGLLLYGAPGTGKTLLAAAVAKECGLNFISIKGPELLSKYIGASEQAVRDTFERAQSAKPCILFFDEFDSLAPRRGHDNTGVTDRVVNQFLTQLDGVEGLEGVYVLAATSRPDLIDPALLRPGRLDKALHCTLPTEVERGEILEALSRQMSLADDVNLHKVAARCNHFTGADLKALLYNAQLAAIHETTDLWGSTIRKSGPAGDKLEKQKDSPPQKDVKSDELLRNPSFEYLLPENGEVKRERNNSSLSEGSSGSDLSAGQSASWEVVIDVSERTPRAERPVMDKAIAASSSSEKPVTERVDGRGRLVAYLPRLEEGVVSVTHRQEEELLSQYQGTSNKTEKKTKSERVIAGISQRHLLEAARTMQPSVSESERRKFSHIYDNFVASKGGGFGGSIGEAGQRATLA